MTIDVNIVYNPAREDVLGRLARSLADGTGWSINKAPKPSVDINYWIIYIGFAQSPYTKTKTAAWFSHWEETIPKKAEWWDIAAQRVDIRTTTAPMYYDRLKSFGATYLVQPPVDSQFFQQRKFRIGIVGYVHPGGRKGENLIKRLQLDLPAHWELVATGKGWDKNTQELAWADLPAWYQSIDLFLNPSLIEGVPMPPLEALAMNKPIVIPHGVGMLDTIEMSEGQGVYRYVAGDYNSLWQTLNHAYFQLTRRSQWAAQYSIENWANQHRAAFEGDDWQFPDVQKGANLPQIPVSTPVVIETSQIMVTNRYKGDMQGLAVYIAYGENARNMATVAIQSWKRHMGVPCCLISDMPLNVGEDVYVYHPDTDIGARSVKTRLYDLVPAEYTHILYLDADTEIVADVGFLFRLLDDGYDFAICFNPEKYFSIGQHLRVDNVEETHETVNLVGHDEMLMYNGGVFCLKRNERTKAFMDMWHEEWQRWGARDQAALLRAMYKSPMKVCYLTQAFNTITRYTPANLTAGIIHHPQSARRWVGNIHGRLDSDEAWKAVEKFSKEQQE